MARRISKAIFKAKACELFRQVETLGETLIVTNYGEPTIEIRRYIRDQKAPLDALRAGIVRFDMDRMADGSGKVK